MTDLFLTNFTCLYFNFQHIKRLLRLKFLFDFAINTIKFF